MRTMLSKNFLSPLLLLIVFPMLFVVPVRGYDFGKNSCYIYLDHCFDDCIDLCWESPIYYRFRVWVNDNKMAWYVFDQKIPRWSNRVHRDKLEAKLKNITSTYGLPFDDEDMPLDYKHAPLYGVAFNTTNPYWTFNQSVRYNLYNQCGYAVYVDVANGSAQDDWEEYADLCLYKALSDKLNGDVDSATYYFNRVVDMWGGSGLYDKVAKENGMYETYKLALLYLTASKLGKKLDFESELINRIWKQQDALTGGIHTHYLTNGTVWGDTNIETTALVCLAEIPEQEKGQSPLSVIIVLCLVIDVLCLLVCVIVLMYVRRSRRKRSDENIQRRKFTVNYGGEQGEARMEKKTRKKVNMGCHEQE